MPYVSGIIVDFSSRLHQVPQTSGELNSYLLEGNTYTGASDTALQVRWSREYSQKYIAVTRGNPTGIYPSGNLFSGIATSAATYGKPTLARVYSTGAPNQVSWTYSGTTPPGGFAIYTSELEEFQFADFLDEIPAGNTYAGLPADSFVWLSPIDGVGQRIGTLSNPLMMRNAIQIIGAGTEDVNDIYPQNDANSPIWGNAVGGKYIDDGTLYFEFSARYSAQAWPDVTVWEQASVEGLEPAPTGYFV